MRLTIRAVAGALLLCTAQTLPNPVGGQRPDEGWTFTTLPQVDLWFHGMALIDPSGAGPVPLYDARYRASVRAAKAGSTALPTPLETRAPWFRDAFQADPAFEVFHFLPLYFGSAGRVEVLDALKRLALTPSGLPRVRSPGTELGVAAAGQVLSTPAQRAVLGEFVAALEVEWDAFLSEFRTAEPDRVTDGALTAIQTTWTTGFEPFLGPLLKAHALSGGTVVLSPPIADEGRIFTGSPRTIRDNMLVVSAPGRGEGPRAVIFTVLRELSFPLVRRAMESMASEPMTRFEAEELSAAAATRTGAMVLERYRPGEARAYKEYFLSKALGRLGSGTEAEGAFSEAFPLDQALVEALKDEVNLTENDGE